MHTHTALIGHAVTLGKTACINCTGALQHHFFGQPPPPYGIMRVTGKLLSGFTNTKETGIN
jgi:hypothetical protein